MKRLKRGLESVPALDGWKWTLLVGLLCLFSSSAWAGEPSVPKGGALAGERYRVLVSTDLGGSDEDDMQSLVHLLVYSDLFDLEGLVSSPPYGGRKEDILDILDIYEKDYAHLKSHSEKFPRPSALRRMTKQGAVETSPSKGWSEATAGSQWIIRQAREKEERPLYVLVWGSITDVAQAVHDAPEIKDKIRVYFIASWNQRQDPAAFEYLDEHHRDMWLIHCNTTFRGWYIGGNQEGDLGNESFVDRHVAGHGALGEFFKHLKGGRLKMGDTPSVAYLLRGDPVDPTSPHWGGRFVRHPRDRPHWWVDDPDPKWEVGGRPGARTVSQFREQYLRSWQKRMDWAADS